MTARQISLLDTLGGYKRALVGREWTTSLVVLALGLAIMIVTFGETVAGAVSIWWNISTYNHCFLILPISLFLVWDRRDATATLTPQPTYWGLLAMLGFGVMWLVANVMDIAEGEQFALVGMIQGLILAILGFSVFRANLMAILYLWLLVPSGQFALAPLQSIAAFFTELQLDLSGIPSFRDGLIFQVPTGLYRIAPGCAGLNFILTAIAVAPIYGYLFYTSMLKRTVAVVVMVLVAILANAVRIFAIIAIAEATDRQIDIVDDHLLYGWGFFSLILLLMGMIGMRWADADAAVTEPLEERPTAGPLQLNSLIVITALALAVVGATATAASIATGRPVGAGQVELDLPEAYGDWRSVGTITNWRPNYAGAHKQTYGRYEGNACCVDVFVGYYWRQSHEHELISNANSLTDNEGWTIARTRRTTLQLGTEERQTTETTFEFKTERRQVWHLYWVDGRYTASKLTAKLLQAKALLLWGDKRSAIVALSVEQTSPTADPRNILDQFLSAQPDFTQALTAGQWIPASEPALDSGN